MAEFSFDEKLVVGISSRALFDLEEENRIFEHEGVESFKKYQLTHENELLNKVKAFPFIEKFLELEVIK